jgi:hypothetical protein
MSKKLNCEKGVYELGDHVGEEALNLNLLPKLGFTKKNPHVSFPNCLLENTSIESGFPYAPLPHHEGAKQNTIGVIRRTNVKQPHHESFVLAYSMENETPFVRHIIEQQGCDYIIEVYISLNERTRGHPKTKPKSKLMQVRWEQGKVLN